MGFNCGIVGDLRHDAGMDAGTLLLCLGALLLGGDKSAPYLKAVLNGLEAVLPHVWRVTLPGVGHLAADNNGKPQVVADQLRMFFY